MIVLIDLGACSVVVGVVVVAVTCDASVANGNSVLLSLMVSWLLVSLMSSVVADSATTSC